jgi:transcriptional regulator with XRE-family HTH domain
LAIRKVSIRQIKAARALVAWSQADLASASGLSEPTIKRLEANDGDIGGRPDTADRLVAALESAGVIFLAENGEGPGLRLRKRAKARASHPAADVERPSRVRGRAKAEAVVDAALAKIDATSDEKADRKRRLTRVPKGLKDK